MTRIGFPPVSKLQPHGGDDALNGFIEAFLAPDIGRDDVRMAVKAAFPVD